MVVISSKVRYEMLATEASKSLGRPLTTREKAFLDWLTRAADTEGSMVLCKMFVDMRKAQ